MRAVIYARYSSDNQREASIEDQIEICKRYIDRQGWALAHNYQDRALSGASDQRPGYQQMLADAAANRFDVVVTEALDRLGRRLSDVARLYDHLEFRGCVAARGQYRSGHYDACRSVRHHGAALFV